jgi:hypothetical protein
MSTFQSFFFTRAISATDCFKPGDIVDAQLTTQLSNRLLDFTTLVAEGDGTECLATAEDGTCLSQGEPAQRVLTESENSRVLTLFEQLVIADQPNVLCAAGNVQICSDDMYEWDGLSLSGDFCQTVHVQSAPEIMALLEDLRDGPSTTPPADDPLDLSAMLPTVLDALAADGSLNLPDLVPDLIGDLAGDDSAGPIEILRVESIMASDQLIGKNGDYATIRTQSELDGALLQDGSVGIDFETEIGIAIVVLRAPCQAFSVLSAQDGFLSVDVQAALTSNPDCLFDLGGVEAHLIVLPKTSKAIRVFLNGSDLDEIRL